VEAPSSGIALLRDRWRTGLICLGLLKGGSGAFWAYLNCTSIGHTTCQRSASRTSVLLGQDREYRGPPAPRPSWQESVADCSRALIIVSLIGVPGFCLGYLLAWDWPIAALIALVGAAGAVIADDR